MTGLEPATSGVTGRCSNQLSYIPKTYQLTTCGNLSAPEVPRVAQFSADFAFGSSAKNQTDNGKNCIQPSGPGSSPMARGSCEITVPYSPVGSTLPS